MRIICTLNDKSKAQLLSNFLKAEGIDNQLEINTNNDWGSPHYSDTTCRIWVYDEDQVEDALKWVDAFQKDPTNPSFKKVKVEPTIVPLIFDGIDEPQIQQQIYTKQPKVKALEFKATITTYLLLICCILFFIDTTTSPHVTALPTYLPALPILASPLKKETLYDYPQTYEIVDKLVKLYGIDKLLTPETLPEEAKYLIQQYQSTPYWQGFYNLLSHNQTLSQVPEQTKDVPMFEKIKQGEVWRLFTPCLMHNDILHILFNMLWLMVLGRQLEQRLKPRRYLLFILLVGIISNTAQYLMTSFNFLGFSGVLFGMLTFIWMRQRIAPWEGYPLEKSTINFMMLFLLALVLIQITSLYLETYHQLSISPAIANTAHLTGAAMGLLLGRLPFFAWKT